MRNQNRILDIIIVIVIIGLSALVYFRLEKILGVFRNDEVASVTENNPPIATQNPTESESSDIKEQTPKPAPDFELMTLDGDKITLSDIDGKSVMINFWATWCPPCRDELPLIEAFAKRYSDRFIVLAVNAGEDLADVDRFISQYEYALVFLLDPKNSVGTTYRVMGLPTSIFIDADGNWQATHIGQLDEPLMTAYLEKIGVIE